MFELRLDIHGPFATHNLPCPVFPGEKKAVYELHTGQFQPSWKAQEEGWRIVKADTRFKKLLAWIIQRN